MRFIIKRNRLFHEPLVAQSSGAAEKLSEALIQILNPKIQMEKNSQTDIEIIDVEEYSKEGKTPPSGKHYRIRIDREIFVVEKNSLTGRELLELASKDPYTDYQLYQKLKGGLVTKVEYDQSVHFDEPGIERFTTQKHTHTDGEPTKFKIQLDRDVKDAPEKCMTGKQILELFEKTPYSDYQLYVKLKGKNA